MPASDVVVVGGGIVGVTAAIEAAGAGASVTVIDRGFNAGSFANAGSLHVQLQSRFIRLYPDKAPNVEASLPLYLEAVREWDRLDAVYGPFELVRDGGLMLAEDEAQMRFLEAKAARERARGLAVELLDRRALERIAPFLGRQIVGAELCRDEGKLNPLVANARLKREARRRGVQLVRDRVTAIEADGTVRAEGGVHPGRQVILAAAWGAGSLLAPLGLDVPTRAEPLHMNITEAGAPAIGHLIQHAERSITLKQFKSGQIVIGGGWPADGRGDDLVPSVLFPSLLGNVALAARLAPGLSRLRILRSWAGMNTTIDGRTVLGRMDAASPIVLALPGDAGYTLGPLVGKAAAAIAGGSRPDFDARGLSPDRFRT